MADVMPLRLWQMLLPQGLMLLPLCVILSYCWLMLLPNSGRCYGHLFCNVEADVIAQWQME